MKGESRRANQKGSEDMPIIAKNRFAEMFCL